MNDQSDTVRRATGGAASLPVVYSGASGERAGGSQGLAASGQRRGLRGGAPVLDAARRLYLKTEWSGRDDRRGGPGALVLARI